MRSKKQLTLLCVLLTVLLLVGVQTIQAQYLSYGPDKCTVVIAGKKATTDGSVITTHTCDCGLCDWTWRYVKAEDHKEGEMRRIYWIDQFGTKPPEQGLKWATVDQNYSGVSIPQPAHTFGYMHGAFGYMNDNQVALGESTIGCRREMLNNTPTAKFDVTMLTLLMMERATSARQAIKFMGEIVEKYGYGHTDTGEMLAIADPNEVWIFEVMPVGPLWAPETGTPGALWCAQRVPDDHVSVCPNESRIGEIDLDNENYFMASPNVKSYAVEHGYWDPNSGEPFSWKKAYSPTEGSAASTNGYHGRLWRFFDLVAPSKKYSADTPNMELPFSVKPDKKVSVSDVIHILKDKYEGTPFYTARGLQGGAYENPNRLPYGFTYKGKKYNLGRAIGVNRAEYVTITQCRDWLPNPVGGIVWLGFGAQDTHAMMPFYIGVTSIPKSFQVGDHWQFNRESARWAFDYVDFHTQVVYSHAIKEVREMQKKWEGGAIARTLEIDEKAKKLYKEDPAKAREFLTDYCTNNANLVVNAWWELGDRLLVEYNHLWHYNIEDRGREALTYPDWWLEELIRYNNLKPVEEK